MARRLCVRCGFVLRDGSRHQRQLVQKKTFGATIWPQAEDVAAMQL